MQQSHSYYAALLLPLALGACHGKLAVLNDPTPDSPTEVERADPTNSGVSSNAPLAECSRLSRDTAASREANLPTPPLQCGVCDCEGSDASCEEHTCPMPTVLPRCKDGSYDAPDNAILRSFEITSYNLNIELEGYGGCGKTDFVLCYIPPDSSTAASQKSYPKTATIKLENTTTPAECDSITFQTLDIDLQTLGEFKGDAGNLVNTNLGLVGLGEQNCVDQSQLAVDHLESLYRSSFEVDRSCVTDADCEAAFIEPSCAGPLCSLKVASHAGIATWRARAAEVDAEVCSGFADKCPDYQPTSSPPLFDVPGCGEPTPPRCGRGQCH